MRILSLETSGLTGSVAALDDDRLLAECDLDPRQRSAQTLAPAIERLLRDVAWRPRDVQLVAAVVGPGSFTGLRLGVTTAKTFAYAAGAEVLGVGTLAVIARRAPPSSGPLAVCVDAQRNEVYAELFLYGGAGWQSTGQPRIVDAAQWLGGLPPEATLTGTGLARHASAVPAQRAMTPAELWAPRAADAGRLAFECYTAGARDDVWKLSPVYLRRSAAEEKRDAQGID